MGASKFEQIKLCLIYIKFEPHIHSLYISELDLPRVSSVCFPSPPVSSQPTGQNTQICWIIRIIVHIRKASRDAPNGVDAAQRSPNTSLLHTSEGESLRSKCNQTTYDPIY